MPLEHRYHTSINPLPNNHAMPSQLFHPPHAINRFHHHSKAVAPTAAAPTSKLQAHILTFPAAPVGEGAAAVLLPVAAGAAEPVVDALSSAPVPLAFGGPEYAAVRMPVPFLHSPPEGAEELNVMSAHWEGG